LSLDYDDFHPRPPKCGKNTVRMDGHTATLAVAGISAQQRGPAKRHLLALLANGLRYSEIENRLGIGTGTLRGCIASLYRQLRVHSRTKAVLRRLAR
jgi:DNA-binding NarL/FixJ family response regulator